MNSSKGRPALFLENPSWYTIESRLEHVFICGHTVDALLESGVSAWVLDDSRLRFVHGNVRSLATGRALARNIDAIVHLAAQVSPYVSIRRPDLTNTTNVDCTLNVLRAATAEKVGKWFCLLLLGIRGSQGAPRFGR